MATRREWTRETLGAGIRSGDKRALARAISLVENGDDGSTEMTPTLRPSSRTWRTSAEISDDFPTPGGPVTPIAYARPVSG